MDLNGSAGGGGAIGWRAPHLAQKTSAASTWFPHWLQKGIRNLIRYAIAECSGKLVARKHLQPSGKARSLRRERHGCDVVLPFQLEFAGIPTGAGKRHLVNLDRRRRL